ncbi:transposase [Halobacterium sp. KA-6]|uniref:transposase n=1 Tax=Halobacterium sp. KA-6 TaxID=2896368 RepID=UPI001E3B16B6|nr:transposase [Halobacterium sp. KA-6]MCD2205116.1 transposase [Halobacterium sp. KA-6]
MGLLLTITVRSTRVDGCSHSACGFTHEENRRGDKFACLQCGKELHANYNAARNIGWRLVQHWLKSGAGRANCQVALKSGTVNGNGDYSPAESIGHTGNPLTSPPL